MDLITHSLSGVAVATVVAAFNKKIKPAGLLLAGAIGGALPDVDTISLWSHFDATIGQFFGLTHTGKVIYFEKFWYSHHGFVHSIAAALLATIVLALGIAAVRHFRNKKPINLRLYWPLLLAFFSAYLLHLFEDMPTPASTWGGVRMLWPLKTYVGGTGQIWWWNNYDIFLAVLFVISLNSLALFIFRKKKQISTYCCVSIFVIGLCFCSYQINNRQTDYAYKGFTKKFNELEQQSLQEQERILGHPAYDAMRWLDRHIPGNF